MREVASRNVEFRCLSSEAKVLHRENYLISREKESYGKVHDRDLSTGHSCLRQKTCLMNQ